MTAIPIELICKALCAIERDLPVDALCYNYSTGKKDIPAWQFRAQRSPHFADFSVA